MATDSQQARNVEVVERWFRRILRGDPAPDLCHPDVEIHNWAESPVPGPYIGHRGLERWWQDVSDSFEQVRLELESAEPVDDERVLTTQRITGRFRATGIALDWSWAAVMPVRDGKLAGARGYASLKRARRALEQG